MNMKFWTVGVVAITLLFLGGTAVARETRQATIANFKGEVLVRHEKGDWQPAQVGMILNQNDEVKTSKSGFAEILLDNGSVGSVKIDRKSLFKIDDLGINQVTGDKFTLLNLAVGKVMVQAAKLQGNSKFEVRTPSSTTGVRGTMFEVSVE